MQPFTVDDLFLHRKVTALHGVPARDDAVAVVRAVDRSADDYRSHLWVLPPGGAEPWQLTDGTGSDTSPRWSPTGDHVAFVSTRGSDAPQLHVIRAEGGEASPCGPGTAGVSMHRWLPDGQGLLVTRSVPVDPDLRGRRGPPPGPRRPSQPEVAWRLPYKRDGTGYLLSREVHLFHLDLATGETRQLTDGPFEVHGFDPSPDGRRVAYVRHREGRFAHRTDLWICDVEGGHHRQFTRDLATVMQPAWSPDGRLLAFASSQVEGEAQSWLQVLDVESGELRRLADDTLEVAAVEDAVQWSADGRRLLVVRARAGCHEIVAVDPVDGRFETRVAGDRQFSAFARTSERLVYAVDSPVAPSEAFACDAATGRDERQLTRLNPWWADRTPLEATRRTFRVPDGDGGEETIEGFLLRARDAATPQPLLDDAHGGPAAYALLDFDTNVFWQVLCSAGWAVLALNPVGSASLGRRFCDRLAGRWGELDLPQHLEAIRQLQASGETDERVAISGKSYGGFLSAWAVGHTPAFRAAIIMSPVGNIETHYGTSDGGYYADPLYLASAPDFDRELARRLSPLQHIESTTTPTLLLQGKDDERCPKCQSEELFVNLCRVGTTPTELVLYPGEDHHFLGEGGPDCRADAAGRIVDWLTSHVTPTEEARHGSP